MGDNTNESSRNTSKEMESLSLQTDRFPRDLLQRFMVSARRSELVTGKVKDEEEDGSDEIELNLGLSLGGRFGVDKAKLMRSSSIAGSIPIVRDDDALTPAPAVSYSSLVRTSSLPVETEEEWRKRKELQSLRRMAAKRRRSEKQRNLRSEKEERKSEREEYVAAMNRVGSSIGPPSGLPSWAAGGSRQAGSGGGGSVESQGGGSGSSMSEMESRPPQGSNSGGEGNSLSMQSLQERSSQDATGSSGAKTRETASRHVGAEMENIPSKNRGKEIGVTSVEDMPCVFTKGDGPNGRRIEGILYKYGKGEEVRIMCVCHGSFLSPAEFVKHAGGTDIDHPLKHIVVNPNPSL